MTHKYITSEVFSNDAKLYSYYYYYTHHIYLHNLNIKHIHITHAYIECRLP